MVPADPVASVVVVNFNSGDYLAGCLGSLRPEHQGGLAAEVVVVDSASTQDQTAALAAVEQAGARVLRLEHNVGYAGGCNHGARSTRGRFVFFLNADVVACPGALPELVATLERHPDLALLEPCTYADHGLAWEFPVFRLMTPRRSVSAALGRISSRHARRRGLAGLRDDVVAWQARGLVEREGLSGAFLATRREFLEQSGGFDTGYPLAYEDTDLFRRARDAGWKVAVTSAARAVHYGHRSRITVMEESVAKDRLGRRRYLRRHHGAAAAGLDRAAGALEAVVTRFHAARPLDRFVALAPSREPPELHLAGAPGPFVLQLGLEPFFSPAAGHLGEGERYRFAEESWRSFLPIPLYVRAFGLPDLAPRGAWVLQRAVGP